MRKDDLRWIILLVIAPGCLALGLYLASLTPPDGLRSFPEAFLEDANDSRLNILREIAAGGAILTGLFVAIVGITLSDRTGDD